MYAAMLSKRLTPPSSRRNFLIASAAGAGALIIGCAFGEGAEPKRQRMGTRPASDPRLLQCQTPLSASRRTTA